MDEEKKYLLAYIFFVISLAGVGIMVLAPILWIVFHIPSMIASIHNAFHDMLVWFGRQPYYGMFIIGLAVFSVFGIAAGFVEQIVEPRDP